MRATLSWNQIDMGLFESDDWRFVIREEADGTFSVKDYAENELLDEVFLTIAEAQAACERLNAFGVWAA